MGEDAGAIAHPPASTVLRASFLCELEPDAGEEPSLGRASARPQRPNDARGLRGLGRRGGLSPTIT
jgi:hypothetical protein